MRGRVAEPSRALPAAASTAPPRTTTAPTGTSPQATHAAPRRAPVASRLVVAVTTLNHLVAVDLVQPLVVDAEVVRDLVHDGLADHALSAASSCPASAAIGIANSVMRSGSTPE